MTAMEEDEHEYHEEDAPLSEDERDALTQDLTDVDMLKELLGPRGIKGAVFYCPDCDEDHYLAWDLLRGNLVELLNEGESPAHEPAFDPNPKEYVSWDYARGYLDGYETFEQEEFDELADKIRDALARRGLDLANVNRVLGEIGLVAGDPDKETRR